MKFAKHELIYNLKQSMQKSYLPQKFLPPHHHDGIKELGLAAFGKLISSIINIDIKGAEITQAALQTVNTLLQQLDPQSIYDNWSQLRLGPIKEIEIDPSMAWSIHGNEDKPAENAFLDTTIKLWESVNHVYDPSIGFHFKSPTKLSVISIKWLPDTLPKSVSCKVSKDGGSTYTTVAVLELKSAGRSDNPLESFVSFSPIEGTHFLLQMHGFILSDKVNVAIKRIRCFTPRNTCALYVAPRTTLNQFQLWLSHMALSSDLSDQDQLIAINALQSLFLSSANVGIALQLAIVLLKLDQSPKEKSIKSQSNQLIQSKYLKQLADQVFVEQRRLASLSEGSGQRENTVEATLDGSCMSTGIEVSSDGLTARSTVNDKGYVLLDRGFTSGKASWEVKLEEDRDDDERTCFGCAIKPIRDGNYQTSKEMWMYRGYNGNLYARGEPIGNGLEKIVTGDVVRCDLDLDEGTLEYTVNGESRGVAFTDLKDVGEIFPAVAFYGKERQVRLISVEKVFDKSDSEVYLSSLTEASYSVGKGVVGKAGKLGISDKEIKIRGLKYLNSLGLHPSANGTSFIKYNIPKEQYESLMARVGLNDNTASCAGVVTFQILGDDNEVLWTSRSITASRDIVDVNVSVYGHSCLTLQVTYEGEDTTAAHSVWLEPVLKIYKEVQFDREMVQSVSLLEDFITPLHLASSMFSVLEQMSLVQLTMMSHGAMSPGNKDKNNNHSNNISSDNNSLVSFSTHASSLVDPFCIDVTMQTFKLCTTLLQSLIGSVQASNTKIDKHSNNSSININTKVTAKCYDKMMISLLVLIRANLYRLVLSQVDPNNIGIRLLSTDNNPPLRPLHKLLQDLTSDHGTFSEAVGQAASAAIDAGIEVLYPTPEERQLLLKELVVGGATLELQFKWPTELNKSSDDGMKHKGNDEDSDYDIRFERIMLLLEIEISNLGWKFLLHGNWSRYIHLVVELPDDAINSSFQFISEEFPQLMSKAGFDNWTFPLGCIEPHIPVKIERYLKFNRKERLNSEPGVGWLHIYPNKAGTYDEICEEVGMFIKTEAEEMDVEYDKDDGGSSKLNDPKITDNRD